MTKLAIFDLDGTLIDTIEDLGTAVNHALGLRGLPQHSIAQYRDMVGHGIRRFICHFSFNHGKHMPSHHIFCLFKGNDIHSSFN